MSKKNMSGRAIAAGAIGSAAIAAAVLYAGKLRGKQKGQPPKTSTAPHTEPGEKPETD